ncbi:FH1/FH2 domain-containing protein 3 [Narcine bancroftii]|uniref:FH1/FH2 domain-containing protein 3 n=1 Tax=Narcine bancroftii TaxID=1343680 RepID=UPI0038322161
MRRVGPPSPSPTPLLPLSLPPPPLGIPKPAWAGTRRLHWKGIQELPSVPKYSRFGPSTIWARLDPVPLDTDHLRDLFGRSPSDFRTPQHGVGRRYELNVLPAKRSNMVNIALKALPAPHLVHAALLSLDRCVLGREALQRLQSLVPTEDEIRLIRGAQASHPGRTLGSAEQFLLRLFSVPQLHARLSLWVFTLDYDSREKEIAEPLFDLKLGMEQLAGNKTFHCVLATLLAIGNFLNGVNAKGFELCYLERVPGVRDTVNKKPLLHHACSIIIQNFPDTTDLFSEITGLTRSAKVDFVQLQTDLAQLELDCKASWDHLKVFSRRDRSASFRSWATAFLRESAQRIIILKAVCRRIKNRFHSFLLYLGYPSSSVRKATTSKFCKMISDFALEYRVARLEVLQQRARQEREKKRLEAEDVEMNGGKRSLVDATVITQSRYSENSQQHEHMKEVLSTPESSRRFYGSLPRALRRRTEDQEIIPRTKSPW